MIHGILNLPRNIWLIGLISLCNDSASEMLYPVIPLYLSSVLMAGPRALGIIEGIAEATASLLKLFSGVIMDRTRTAKPWIILGYSLAGFGRPLIALAGSWGWLLLIRFADRVGKGLRTSPRDALLASCAAPNQRGLAFGLHRAMDNAGAVIGPLLAFALLSREVPLAHIFLWAIVPALICLALSLKIRESAPAASAPKRVAFDWRLGDMPSVFKRYLVVVALFTLGNSSNMFLLLRAKEVGMPSEYVPLLWAAVSAVAMIFPSPCRHCRTESDASRYWSAAIRHMQYFTLESAPQKKIQGRSFSFSASTACLWEPLKGSKKPWWLIWWQKTAGGRLLAGST